MEEFPGNSRSRPTTGPINNTPPIVDPPKLEKVVQGKVIRRKKPVGRRLMDTFFAAENGVFKYLAKEVLLPALQDLITDTVRQGIERAVYGEVRSPGRGYRGSSSGRPHISYNTASRPSGPYPAPIPARRPINQPSALDIGEVILDTQIDAQVVMEGLFDSLREYNAATVANLKELSGETPLYTDHKYGWTDLDNAMIKRVHGGYLLVLPPPEDLRR